MTDTPQDVLVIGGGIVGMACAHYLRRAGLAVTIIDQGQLGGACSSGNCGLVCPGHVLPLTMPGAIRTAMTSIFNPRASFRVKPQFRAELYRWLFEFASRCKIAHTMEAARELKSILDVSAAEYRELFADGVLDADYAESGTTYAFRTEAAFRHFESTDVRLAEELGVRIRRYDASDVTNLDPSLQAGTYGAFHYEDDAFVDPGKLCQSWAKRLAADGVRIAESTSMTGLDRRSNSIVGIQTTAGRLEAQHYVFALGSWSRHLSKLAGLRLPVEPGKGYSVIVDNPATPPALPLLFPETRVVATPLARGLRLGSMMEFAGFDTSLPAARLRQLVSAAAPFLGLPEDAHYREEWYGWRPMTWDSLPIIGKAPGIGNALVATGHNMLGTTLAPATGRLVTELLTGQSTVIDPAAFSPARF